MSTSTNKYTVWLLVLGILILATFILLSRRHSQAPTSPEAEPAAEPSVTPPPQSPRAATQGQTTAPSPQTRAPAQSSVPEIPRQEMLRKDLEQNNVPVAFYGIAIDQYTQVVAGVRVVINVRHWINDPNSPGKPPSPSFERLTDASGRFSVEGVTGDALTIEAADKEGYILDPSARRSFAYGPAGFRADANTPVILHLWRKTASAQLVSQDKDTRIPYDGTLTVFDLLTGQKFADNRPGGDLRVTLTRTPLNIPPSYQKPFEWQATIEAIGGGLIQSDDEFMYAAPEEGYQPRIQITMPADATNWANTYGLSFYTKTRGGSLYGRVRCEFRVDSPKPQTGFTLTSSVNPTGSRNLQP